MEQICLKSLLQEFEEVVSGRKKLKTFANDAGTKTTRKKLGVGKKNSNRRNRRTFLEKVVRKTVALTKTF